MCLCRYHADVADCEGDTEAERGHYTSLPPLCQPGTLSRSKPSSSMRQKLAYQKVGGLGMTTQGLSLSSLKV